jgi:hypothetical protein
MGNYIIKGPGQTKQNEKTKSNNATNDSESFISEKSINIFISIIIVIILLIIANNIFKYMGKSNPMDVVNPINWFEGKKYHPYSKTCGTTGCYKCTKDYKESQKINNSTRIQRGCMKCGCENPRKICDHCYACAECKIEDKCGSCQYFEGQVSLDDKKKSCPGCGKKTCECSGKNGKPVIKEPGAYRGGVYSSCMGSMVYI